MLLDTPEYIEKKMIEMMQSRTGEERFEMLMSMNRAGRMIAVDGIRSLHPDYTNKQIRKELFRRLYGDEFTEEQIEKISAGFTDDPIQY